MEVFPDSGFRPWRAIPRTMGFTFASGCAADRLMSLSFIRRTRDQSVLDVLEEDSRLTSCCLSGSLASRSIALLGSIIDTSGSAPGPIDPPNIGKATVRKAGSHCFVIENRNRGMLQPPPGRTLIPKAYLDFCTSPINLVGKQLDVADRPNSANFNRREPCRIVALK